MVSARWRGSSASRGSGRPCATSQKGQRRVHRSPMIMKVAVPCPKHSPMLGHDASSQTVCRLASRRIRLISAKRSPPPARTRIHSGLRSGFGWRTLIGIRAVLRSRLRCSFRSESDMACTALCGKGLRGEDAPEGGRETLLHRVDAITDPQEGEARRFETRVSARIDTRERLQGQVHVEREPVIRASARDAKPDGGDLAAVDINAGPAAHPLAADAVLVEHRERRLLEAAHQLLHPDAHAPQVEEHISDRLPGTMKSDLPAAIGANNGDVARGEHVLVPAGEPKREDRRMLEKPDLVASPRAARLRKRLHRPPGRLVRDAAEAAEFNHRRRFATTDHRTMITRGLPESSEYSASSCARDFALMVTVSER